MIKSSETYTLETAVPSDSSFGRAVQDWILRHLELLEYDVRERQFIRLAVEEALANAVKHGNRLDPEKKVTVNCRICDERVWVEIEDEGEGFDPHAVPDPRAPEYIERPHGRGVMLIEKFMDSVEYNDRGNRVVMEKLRTV